MLLLTIMALIILSICSIVMFLASILSKKVLIDLKKNSPFEWNGFDPKSSSRILFSLHFFLITIIFLILDFEVALILPMIMILNFSNSFMWSMTSIIFIIILLIGVYHEKCKINKIK